MAADFDRIYRVGAKLLDCACTMLAQTQFGCPPRICLVPGESPSVENCCAGQGQLTVNVARIFESRSFPVADAGTPANCDVPLEVVVYEVEVWRCAPVGSPHSPPTCDALDDTARITMSDMTAVRWGIKCCLNNVASVSDVLPSGYRWTFEEHITKGPEGGCVGSSLSVVVGLPQCWEC